jgi:hypothetical protein
MNDPSAMMDVARRHFLERYGSSLGNPLTDLDPNGQIPSATQLSTPVFSTGVFSSPEAVGHQASRAQERISRLNARDGEAENQAPGMHDAATHLVDMKRLVEGGVVATERRVADDERVLHDERARRYEDKSAFTNSNPGGKPGSELPLTTQREFDTGGENPPDQRP